MAFTTIPVAGTYKDHLNRPLAGVKVVFTLDTPKTNEGAATSSFTFTSNGSGAISGTVQRMNDPGTVPTRGGYWVTESHKGRVLRGQRVRPSVGQASVDLGTFVVAQDGPDAPGEDAGYIGWNFDPAVLSASTAPATGVTHLCRVDLRKAREATGVAICVNGAGATGGAFYAGLYNDQGQRIAVTADEIANIAQIGVRKMNFTAPIAVQPGTYYVGLLSTAGTAPAINRTSQIAASGGGSGNAGVVKPGVKYSTIGSGLTALQTSVALADVGHTNTTSYLTYWVGIY